MRRLGAAAVAAALTVLSGSGEALAQAAEKPGDAPVVGRARVIGADAVEVSGKRYFLYGIDAFEEGQTCFLNGKPWQCGSNAFRALQILADEGPMTCVQREDNDRRRRTMTWGTCKIGNKDIAEEMVKQGMAVALREQSLDYVPAEEAAKKAGTGAWAGNFVTPWDFRDQMRGMTP